MATGDVRGFRGGPSQAGGAFPSGTPEQMAERLEARAFLASRIVAPGLHAPALMRRVEDELFAMTPAERVWMEIDMRQAEGEMFTAEYEASAWSR